MVVTGKNCCCHLFCNYSFSHKGDSKAPISQMTNEQLVQEIATRSENKIGGAGRVAGTQKHTC